MFSHPFYNVLHVIGIVLVVSALGGASLHAINGGTRATNAARGLVAAMHGTGVLLILLGGFGMLARLGFAHGANFPRWLWVKLLVWVIVAGALMIPYRKPELSRPLLLALPVLAGIAAAMAIYKPF